MKKILFLLGSANISGGTYVILQHAHHLQKSGYQVVIALVFMKPEEYLALKNSPDCWHPAIKELQFIHIDEAKQYKFDAAIFTWWATLFSFEKINASSYIYFVQSIESRFYDKHETFMKNLVNRTYQTGLPCITEATWIQQVLKNEYHNPCELVRNGIIKSLYTINGNAYAKKSAVQLRILVEGPLNVAFKNVERTIEICKRANVGEIWLLTSSKASHSIPGVDRVFSQVPITSVPDIYRSCDVIVKLSYVEGMFGPPLEMFHCGGTAIVYEVTGHDEYIVHGVNALVAKTNDEEAVINYLRRLNEDRNLLSRLIAGANETARKWISWEQSSNDFALSLEKLINEHPVNQSRIQKNISACLKECLDIVIIKDNHQTEKEYKAEPLYDSGYYVLSIPVSAGNTQIGIAFGKIYSKFHITRIILADTVSQPVVQCNVSCFQMVQQPDNMFECKSTSGMLVLNINLQVDKQVNSKYMLQIEFHPMAVWENVGAEVVA